MRWTIVSILAAVTLSPPEASAWDYFGHHVVGAVAWDFMEPATREAVVALLLKAPPDAGLASLLPPNHRAIEERHRELFLKANGWADLVRDERFADRKARYDHGSWHYVNRFWTSSPSGPKPLDERGTMGELVTELERLVASVADARQPAFERAVDLAWILHLVGDVHQPLHSSGRVTELEPRGDRGGNDFLLGDPEAENLHAYWDFVLRRNRLQHHSESYFAWVTRVAHELVELYPEKELGDAVAVQSPDAWSKEGAAIAMRAAYPSDLVRGTVPSRKYRDDAFALASKQAALAGYRLARLLDRAIGARL